MPDTREHRGPHPEDGSLFARSEWPRLGEAVRDLSWLLSRGYAAPSALKLVGDRLGLNERQRRAVARSACSDQARDSRRARQVDRALLAGRPLCIDGYNVLTTIEVALGGAVLLKARDGTLRDIASLHGTYRRVAETVPALERLAAAARELKSGEWRWFFDAPVSNSGRLKTLIADFAAKAGLPWRVELVPNPDPLLSASPEIVASADSVILDRCRAWYNLAADVVASQIASAAPVPLG